MGTEHLNGRQQGQTANQMLAAPLGSYYVWPNSHLTYPKALARHLGRLDLRIVPAHSIQQPHGRFFRHDTVVIDHAAWFNDRLYRDVDELRHRVDRVL